MSNPTNVPYPPPSLAPAGRSVAGLHGPGAPTLVERVATWARFLVDAPTPFTRPDRSGVLYLALEPSQAATLLRLGLIRPAPADAAAGCAT